MDIKQAASAYSAIAGITPADAAASAINTSSKTQGADTSFSDLVADALGGAVDSGYKAEKVSTLALMGKADMTELATAVGAAETALNTVVAIRDKVIAAYQQITQMPM